MMTIFVSFSLWLFTIRYTFIIEFLTERMQDAFGFILLPQIIESTVSSN